MIKKKKFTEPQNQPSIFNMRIISVPKYIKMQAKHKPHLGNKLEIIYGLSKYQIVIKITLRNMKYQLGTIFIEILSHFRFKTHEQKNLRSREERSEINEDGIYRIF